VPGLELYLLGSPRLERDGEAVAFDSRKQLALIAYLAMTGRSHTREALITLLWPELEPSRGRAGLRRDLSVIRKALDGQWLAVEGETVGTDPAAGFWLDVAEFRDLLGAWRGHGHLEAEVCPRCLTALGEAVALYQGDFMAGMSLRDSAAFDEWQFFQTEGLRGELARALERLVRGYSRRRVYEEAIPYARRWVALDPLHEPAHRALMEAYGRAGQRAAATRQYEECVRVLEAELGVGPSEETTGLYERLRTRGVEGGPAPRHNLPAQVTPFVGRERELDEILARLRDPECRLLTLVGPGGMGKTRLALRAAELARETQAERYEHGVYYVRLGPLGSAEGMVPAVAEAMGFRFYERGEPREQLLAYLRKKRLLLLMDSFEHLLEGVGLITEILQTAPEVKLLVTSRIRLNLRGEHLLPVEGMEYPGPDAPVDARAFSAVELFLQGARRTLAGPDWEPTPEEMGEVVRVCGLVAGMPLGILLAAAWVEMLTPAEIAAEIRGGLDILATDLQDVPVRQRSLRAVFDHSWRLLTEREQEVFQRLSIFRGGFTGEAAREVAGASLRELRGLLGKSCLERGANGRYEMHELLRGYAAEKLDRSPDEVEATRERHGVFYAQAMRGWGLELKGPGQLRALAEMDVELDNLRVASNWGVEVGSLDLIEPAAEALSLFYGRRGYMQEGEAMCQRAAERLSGMNGPDARRVLAKILIYQGSANFSLGRNELAGRQLQASCDILEVLQQAGHDVRAERAEVLWALGFPTTHLQEKQRVTQESLALCQEIDDRWGSARALESLGWVARNRGDYERAYELVEESLTIRRALGDQWGVASSLQVLGNVAGRLSRYEEAELLLRESTTAFEEIGDKGSLATGLGRLATALFGQGRFDESLALLTEAADMSAELGVEEGQAWWRIWLADCLASLGEYNAAQEVAELACAHYQQGGHERGKGFSLYVLGRIAVARGAYAEARELLEEASSLLQGIGVREGVAMARTCLAYAHLGTGELRRAAGLLGDGLVLAREIGAEGALSSGLAALAWLLALEGEAERALELFATVSRTWQVSNSQWIRDVVGHRIAEAAAVLLPEAVRAAEERGRARDPEALVAELLGELAH
jgi:predicted ATPase/DNA-binding SARP family transcriptional activator